MVITLTYHNPKNNTRNAIPEIKILQTVFSNYKYEL